MRALFSSHWDVPLEPEPGLRIPSMFDAAIDGSFRALYVQGEDIAQSDPNTEHVTQALRSMECIIIQELFINETAKFAHVFTTGRILTQYNAGAQTRRTQNVVWHSEDRIDLHPHDAENRGIVDGDWVAVRSRAGETVLRARLTHRMQPGVVYTTFHPPESGANVVTTENASYFESELDRTVALESIAGHLKRFWDPRMRRELLRWQDEHHGEVLRDSVRDAIAAHRDKLLGSV